MIQRSQSPLEFQRNVSLALKQRNAACPSQVVERENDQQSRRFDIYRNNRTVSLVENLKATYPVVCKLVGDGYFAAVAREFINQQPPSSPVMAEYGGDFGAFIKQSPNAEKIPYIGDVAALEWARLQSYHAADAPVLPVDVLASFSPEQYGALCFTVHPSLRSVESMWSVGRLWALCQTDEPPDFDLYSPEHVVVARPWLDVLLHVLPANGAALFYRFQQGDSLLEAVEFVTKKNPDFDPGTNLQGLISLGLFSSIYLKGQ